MAVFAEDDFDRSNRSLSGDTASDGGTWGSFGGGIGTSMSITSNYAHSNDGGPNHLIHSGTPGANDYTITASVALRAENGRVGLLARCDGSGSGYRFQYDNATNRWQLQRFDSGSLTTIDNNAPVTMGVYAASDLVLDVSGSSLSGSYDGTERASTTDATYSTGQVGIMGYGGSGATSGQYEGEIHTFSANDTSSGGTTVSGSTASLTLSTNAASVNAEKNIFASAASLAFTTNQATVTVGSNTEITASTASLTLTPNQATVQVGENVNVNASTASLALSTNQASVNAQKAISASVASLTLSGKQASIGVGQTINATAASLTFSAKQAAITYSAGTVIAATTASLSFTTNTASISSSLWTEVNAASTSWSEISTVSTTWTEV